MTKKIIIILTILTSVQFCYGGIGFDIPSKKKSVTTYGNQQLEQSLPSSFNILVWNIYKGDFGRSFQINYPLIIEDKDLVLLQEATDDPDVLHAFAARSDLQYQFVTSFSYDKDDRYTATGVALASPVKPHKFGFKRTKLGEYLVTTPKTLNYAQYKIDGFNQKVLVINIHSLNWVPDWAHLSQLNSVRSLIASHKGPVIFGGDFNTNTKKKMENLRKLAKKYGLKEVELIDGHRRLKAPNVGIPLDHVFVRGLDIKVAYVGHNYRGSDHTSLILEASPFPYPQKEKDEAKAEIKKVLKSSNHYYRQLNFNGPL